MTIPAAQAGAEQAWPYSSLPKTVTLSGAGTPSPIVAWRWTMLYVPPGSTAATGTNGNFVNGVSTIQNPSFVCDVRGCYVLQLEVANVDSTGNRKWSIASVDRELAQTPVYILTNKFGLRLPGAFLWRYDADLNTTLADMETAINATSVDTTALHKATGGEISAMTSKSVPVSDDVLVLEDSAASFGKKKVRIGDLPPTVDTTAIHKATSGEISALTEKTTPVSADVLVLEDSAATFGKKKVQVGNLPGGAPRWLVYREDTEYSEPGLVFANKITFRTQRDAQKKPTTWRIGISMKSTVFYSGKPEARIKVTGSGGSDSVTILGLAGNTEQMYYGTITISETNEPTSEMLTVEVDLRNDASGDTAYFKLFEFVAVA